MLLADPTDEQISRLVHSAGWNLDEVWIVPQSLGLDEVNAVLVSVFVAFPWIELELHGIEIIPLGWWNVK